MISIDVQAMNEIVRCTCRSFQQFASICVYAQDKIQKESDGAFKTVDMEREKKERNSIPASQQQVKQSEEK